jgi:acyl-CoA thioesterase-1
LWGYGARRAARNLLCGIVLAVVPIAAAAKPVTIAALGDSLTQGYGLPPEAGFVPQLNSWLKAHGQDVHLLNAGVSGDTTAGGLSRIDWTLTPDVDALIVELGGNDVLRGIAPDTSRANLDAILRKADAAGIPVLLIGVPAPANYGPDYKAAFDAIYPDLAARHGTLLVENFFRGLVPEGSDSQEARRRYLQADGLHPNAAGVERIVADLGPEVLLLIQRASP